MTPSPSSLAAAKLLPCTCLYRGELDPSEHDRECNIHIRPAVALALDKARREEAEANIARIAVLRSTGRLRGKSATQTLTAAIEALRARPGGGG